MIMRFTYCALLGFLIAFATPIVTPAGLINKPKDSRSGTCSFRRSGWPPRYDWHICRHDTTTHHSLPKRAHSLQIRHMHLRTMTVPVFQAASALSYFYVRVLQECASTWAHNPPLYVLRITNGFFALELYSNTNPIPWALIAEVASNMLAITHMGFTGTYDIWYADSRFINGVGVLVKFRILNPNAGAGRVVVDTPLGSVPA